MLRRLKARVENSPALVQQLDYKIACFEEAIIGCLGIDVECNAERAHVAAGERVRIQGRVWNPRGVRIDDVRLTLRVPQGWKVTPSSSQESVERMDWDVVVAADAPPSVPSWLRKQRDGYRYQASVEGFACAALDPPPIVLEGTISFEGQPLAVRRPAIQREPFPGGYRDLPLAVLPPSL